MVVVDVPLRFRWGLALHAMGRSREALPRYTYGLNLVGWSGCEKARPVYEVETHLVQQHTPSYCVGVQDASP